MHYYRRPLHEELAGFDPDDEGTYRMDSLFLPNDVYRRSIDPDLADCRLPLRGELSPKDCQSLIHLSRAGIPLWYHRNRPLRGGAKPIADIYILRNPVLEYQGYTWT
jgi:hypothetical protein